MNLCFNAVKTVDARIVNFGFRHSCLSSNWFKLALLIDRTYFQLTLRRSITEPLNISIYFRGSVIDSFKTDDHLFSLFKLTSTYSS